MIFTNSYYKTLNPSSNQHVKSFYGKAKVEIDKNSTCEILYSYDTPVLGYCMNKFYRLTNKWSLTTGRHINGFLAGYDEKMNKQSFFTLPLTERIDFDNRVRKAQQVFKAKQKTA